MTVIIDDRYKSKALEALSANIPKEAYKVKPDPLREELKRRIEEIDSGKVELMPFDRAYSEEMDRFIDSL